MFRLLKHSDELLRRYKNTNPTGHKTFTGRTAPCAPLAGYGPAGTQFSKNINLFLALSSHPLLPFHALVHLYLVESNDNNILKNALKCKNFVYPYTTARVPTLVLVLNLDTNRNKENGRFKKCKFFVIVSYRYFEFKKSLVIVSYFINSLFLLS